MRTIVATFIIKVTAGDERIDHAISDFLHRLADRPEIKNWTYNRNGNKFYFSHVQEAGFDCESACDENLKMVPVPPRDRIVNGEISVSWKKLRKGR